MAQGFGVGRIPVAPGTFGSVIGLLWFGLLIATGHVWSFVLGSLGGLAVSVWLCGYGERILGQKDPGAIVLDEVTAMPLCFTSWVGVQTWRSGIFPTVGDFVLGGNWLPTVAVFVAFRVFDIWKPWPVRQSQRLPGGWGVTIDDALAALYVAVLALVFLLYRA